MKRYFYYRIFMTLPILLGISLIAFILGILSPGDPAELVLTQNGLEIPTYSQILWMREELGLDKPMYVQYLLWLSKILHGDFGCSYISGKDILQEITIRLPITLELACTAMIFTVIVGMPLGIVCALFKFTWLDNFIQFITNIILAIPNFWLALIMILIFCERYHILPTSGSSGFEYFILPALTISFSTIAIVCRFVRSSIIKEFNMQYFIIAKARGISEFKLIIYYALPNAIFPTIALLGNYFASILGGSVIAESIFALPGIGSMALEAINFRDYPVLQAYVLITGWILVIVTLIVDIALFYINPRVRAGIK